MANKIQNNNTSLEQILAAINALPEAGSGGVDLPELSNPGNADDLIVGKQLIDGDGEVVTGTNPYEKASTDAKVNEQADLLQQITTTLAGKTAVTPILQSKTVTPTTSSQSVTPDNGYDGLSKVTVEGDANLIPENIAKDATIFGVTGTHEGGEDVSAETTEYTSLLTDLETTIDALPDAGNGGGTNIETCTVTFTNGGNILIYGSALNEAGEIIPIIGSSISDELSLTVIKGAGIIFVSDNWEYAFHSTVVTGAEIEGTFLQGGMAYFTLVGQSAHFEFVRY